MVGTLDVMAAMFNKRLYILTRGGIAVKLLLNRARKIDCRHIGQTERQSKHAWMKGSRSWSKTTSLLSLFLFIFLKKNVKQLRQK